MLGCSNLHFPKHHVWGLKSTISLHCILIYKCLFFQDPVRTTRKRWTPLTKREPVDCGLCIIEKDHYEEDKKNIQPRWHCMFREIRVCVGGRGCSLCQQNANCFPFSFSSSKSYHNLLLKSYTIWKRNTMSPWYLYVFKSKLLVGAHMDTKFVRGQVSPLQLPLPLLAMPHVVFV